MLIVVPPLMGVLDNLVATVGGGGWFLMAEFLCMNHSIRRITTTMHTTIKMLRWVSSLIVMIAIEKFVLSLFLYTHLSFIDIVPEI